LESVELRGTDHGKDVGSIRKSAIFLVKALVHFLARKLGVKNSGVEIITGHTTRLKRIKVIGEGTKTKERISRLTILQS